MTLPGRLAIVRWLKFNAVGAMGIVVQLLALALWLRVLGVHYMWATVLAVETAVLHNFCWHWRWTWADRRRDGFGHMAATLFRFNLSNGMISLFGTVLTTGILTGIFKLNPLLANVLSLGPCCVINYLVSDRLIFMSLDTGESA
ncbi:MAG TPA: GtrA family protein [Terriglobia bacterium]|nr:GtrA family protein [Terriglobia bacterium]